MGATGVLPPDGSNNVSTATSIIVVAGPTTPAITLIANGAPVEFGAPLVFGDVQPRRAKAWRLDLPAFLNPSTTYEVVGDANWSTFGAEPDAGEAPVTLSRFTTAAGYDKAEGTPPQIRSLRFFRIRYPKEQIASGNCVFSEYHGFIAFDMDAASIPNTTPEGTLYTLRVAPETGGTAQSVSFVGSDPYEGRDPTGDPLPQPSFDWMLDLDPTRRYCATLTAQGDGDLARSELRSEPRCAAVEVVCLPGSEDNGGPDTTCNADEEGCGCAIVASSKSAGTAWAALLALSLAVRRRSPRVFGQSRAPSRNAAARAQA